MKRPKQKPKLLKTAKCMVCGQPIEAKTGFTKATGLGVCKSESCRMAFAEAGIV